MAIDRDKVAGSVGNPDESPISFALDIRSGVPTYLQIVQQVEASLRLGHLQSGDRLPKVKDVVTALSINPNTVLKAYRELENRGITIGRPGVGTFIIAAPLTVSAETFLELRSLLIEGWLQSARERGLQFDEIAALFNSALGEVEGISLHEPST
ncbi:MAG TPA: GntR family transcriptional regulator [Acidimicrobiales bacterium]|jgi:GntR family transcriptional regulator|nr:GntR family transcriptional regulator [Acidimicrobiales bacterium]